MYLKNICIAFVVSLLIVGCHKTETKWPILENYGTHRSIAFTDKGRAVLYLASDTSYFSPWHGLTVSKQKIFHGVDFYLGDNNILNNITNYTVSPLSLEHVNQNNLRLTWTLLDTMESVLIEYERLNKADDSLVVAITLPAISQYYNQAKNCFVTFENETRNYDMTIQSSSHLIKFSQSASINGFSSILRFNLNQEKSGWLVISATKLGENAKLFSNENIIQFKKQRELRLIKRLAKTDVTSNSSTLDSTLFWANSALDALVMNQLGKGIYAGLPWFDDYWGRDTFISFMGTVLVSGEFETAREILLSFAELQDTNPASVTYGRVPNRAMPIDIIYNTTDGTPWFVRSAWDYYRYSGDKTLLEIIWPSIKMATDGALRNIDEHGFLIHDDADTWMDAKGADGPWSPRGNRAIDIQQLWLDQLKVTERITQILKLDSNADYADIIHRIEANISLYWDTHNGILADHINKDGSVDTQIRPNALLVPALDSSIVTFDDFRFLSSKLVTQNGVLSLAQDDAAFHPYHELPSRYVKDEAYHNGIIWTWNSGPIISKAYEFNQTKMAETLFNELGNLVLHRGALGGIAEVTDAWPREHHNDLQLSGTYSQAWSLAEYLRTFNQDILGIHPDLSIDSGIELDLSPRLLDGLNDIKFRFRMGNDWIEGEYLKGESQYIIMLNRGAISPVKLSINLLLDGVEREIQINWVGKSAILKHEILMKQWTIPDDIEVIKISAYPTKYPENTFTYCEIDTTLNPPSLAGPNHRLLTPREIKTSVSTTKIIELIDAIGDDRGESGSYHYPLNRSFQKGIADIQSIQVKRGNQFTVFTIAMENLVDPGWHPEYGYQLTYIAIGLDINDGKGSSIIGKNANDIWKHGFLADCSIYVSGGIIILDDKLSPIAEYLPSEPSHAIGNIDSKIIQFSLPNDIFEMTSKSMEIQVVVGLQDDHGGAGLGNFREVRQEAGEWWGGGAQAPESSRVYDWLIQ